MPSKPRPKKRRKLTDAERHARFVALAREIQADERPDSFDKAFQKVTKKRASPDKRV
jgi:hypothetical protein